MLQELYSGITPVPEQFRSCTLESLLYQSNSGAIQELYSGITPVPEQFRSNSGAVLLNHSCTRAIQEQFRSSNGVIPDFPAPMLAFWKHTVSTPFSVHLGTTWGDLSWSPLALPPIPPPLVPPLMCVRPP